jgi:hypothetical protein
MSDDRAERSVRVNPALAVFGVLCVVVSVLVLAGERDWGWLADSYLAPAILLGLGGIVLAATLWPAGRTAATTRRASVPLPPDDADRRGSVGGSPGPAPAPVPPPPPAEEP